MALNADLADELKVAPAGRFRRYSHGHSGGGGSREYHAYNAMIARCTKPNVPNFARYGARGISVCDRWLGSFEAFLSDMGRCPSPSHSVDRRDNDGNYEPSNCYWATPTEQANNRRSNVTITHEGRTMTPAQWARELGLKQSTICWRTKAGWPVEDILRTEMHTPRAIEKDTP